MPQRILLNKLGKNEELPSNNATMNFVSRDSKPQAETTQQPQQQWKEEQYTQPQVQVKKPYKEIPVVTQLPKVESKYQIQETKEMKDAAQQMTKYIPLVQYDPKNYYQPPQGESRKNFSFIKQDSVRQQQRRQSLAQMYNYNSITHRNRYSSYQRRSQIPMDYYNVEVPKQGKTPDYVPKDNQFMTPEDVSSKHQRSRSPNPWQKSTTWDRKFYTKSQKQTRGAQFDGPEYTIGQSHRPLNEEMKKSLQSHLQFKDGMLAGTEIQQTRKMTTRPKDHKSVFMPLDNTYGISKFRGQFNDLDKLDTSKAGMRPISQIKDERQQVAGIKSDYYE